MGKRICLFLVFSIFFVLVFTIPVMAQTNSSLLAIKLNASDYDFASSTYVEVARLSFNTTRANTYLLSWSSMNLKKISGAGSNEVWINISINGRGILEEKLRTVDRLRGDLDEGSVGTKPVLFNVSSGKHNLSISFRRTGNGAIEVNDINLNLGEFLTTQNKSVGRALITANYVHSSTSFTEAFNFTMNKTTNSSTFLAGKFTLQATTEATASYYFKDLVDNETSSFWQRYLSSSSDIGSVSQTEVEINPNYGFRNHTIFSKTTAGTVTVNGTIIYFDLKDAANNTINHFQASNASTNASSNILLSAGTHLLTNQTVTNYNGTSYFLTMTTSFGSNSGSQLPKYFINSSQLPESSCYSKKERYLASNSDIGNAFIYMICEGLTSGNRYNFNLWVTVEDGETLEQMEESLNGFEASSFASTALNVPPLTSITYPNPAANLSGSFYINLSVTDQNGDSFISNLTLTNSTTLTEIAINLTQDNSSVLFDSATVADGVYNLTLLSCENDTTELYCSNHSIKITIDNTPPVINNLTNTSITRTSVSIEWTTNEAANSSIRYGTTSALASSNSSASLTTSHSISLSGLNANTLYYYNVTACDSVGNCNITGMYNFTTLASSTTTTPTTSSGTAGGSTSYLREITSLGPYVLLKARLPAGKSEIYKLKDDKDTGVKKIIITADKSLSGEIKIRKHDKKPDRCQIQPNDEYFIYKILEFNHTIPDDSMKSVTLDIGVGESWIKDNEISDIQAIKCYPHLEILETKYVNKTNVARIYEVKSKGFSVWAIIGVQEPEEVVEEKQPDELIIEPLEEIKKEPLKERKDVKIAFIIIFIALIIYLASIFFGKRKGKK